MKILAFGAHPDDVEVASGGTLIKYARLGHQIRFVVATVPSQRAVRIREAHLAAEFIGAEIHFLDLAPDSFRFDRALVGVLDEVLSEFSPDAILTHWVHDSHQDHVTLSQGVLAAARKNRCSLYMYEQMLPGGITPFPFQPHVFIDISEVVEDKLRGLLFHESQVRINGEGWLPSIRGRAANWGYMINARYAEVFQAVKVLNQL